MTYHLKAERYHANLAAEIHLHKDWHIYCGFYVGKEGLTDFLH